MTATTSSRPTRCAPSGTPRSRRRATTRCSSPSGCSRTTTCGPTTTGCRSSRCPKATPSRRFLRHEVMRGLDRRFPGGPPQEYLERADYEIGVINEMGFPAYFLVVGDLINHARGGRHPRRSRSWFGGRFARRLRDGHHQHRPHPARSAVRAIPQPRARVDARYRYRLRRSSPRRDGALRHREVGQRQGRPGHHVRHHQDQGRHQGLRASPVRAARFRDRRSDHQGAAAADHGQGHLGRPVSPIPSTSGTRRPSRSARSSTPTRTSRRSTRPRRVSRA